MEQQHHFTDIFAHDGRTYTSAAFNRDGSWEIRILDEGGLIRCSWRPDPSLVRQAPITTIPIIISMMVNMVQSGMLPLQEPRRAD